MSNVATLKTAADFRRENNTLREMLGDTSELLRGLHVTSDSERIAIQVQIEAINEVLTDGSNSD